jgi:phage terminase large subunit
MWNGKEDELLKSCTRAYNHALKNEAQITYDSIGVGAGCGAKFKELNGESDNRLQYAGFNAGGAVFNPDGYYEIRKRNKDMFSNIKAQSWWLLGDRFRNTYNAVNNGHPFDVNDLISIDSNTPFLEQLIDELSTPRRDYDQAGRVKVESKKDLDKRGIPSPNLADAAVMAFAPGYSKIKIKNTVFGKI